MCASAESSRDDQHWSPLALHTRSWIKAYTMKTRYIAKKVMPSVLVSLKLLSQKHPNTPSSIPRRMKPNCDNTSAGPRNERRFRADLSMIDEGPCTGVKL